MRVSRVIEMDDAAGMVIEFGDRYSYLNHQFGGVAHTRGTASNLEGADDSLWGASVRPGRYGKLILRFGNNPDEAQFPMAYLRAASGCNLQ